MKVITVFLMVVAVLVSTSTLVYGEDIDSEKLCEQIRSNKLDILTMGARGKSLEDAHFYILAKGGYMFKVPLANLRVDAAHKTTSITIDRDHIRADTLIGESQDLFTRTDRFFLISNQYQEAFLGRMEMAKTDLTKQSIFRLYSLDGENISQNSISAVPIDVVASIGIDSITANGFELKDDKQLFQKAIIGVHRKDEIKVGSSPSLKIMEFSSNAEIFTAFYHQENQKKEEAGYYFFLDTAGLVTVAQRQSVWAYSNDRFEVNLSSFVECYLKPTTILPQRGADSPTKTITGWILDHKWIVALGVGTIVVLGGLVLCLYFTFFKKKIKAKRKGRKQRDSSNESSNASTISRFHTTTFQASKASSVLQSVKSGLTSWLSGNKSKQAKTVAKAKKTKAKKPK